MEKSNRVIGARRLWRIGRRATIVTGTRIMKKAEGAVRITLISQP
jgi:hypothetical protein